MKDINEDNLEFNFYDDKESKYKEIPSLIKIKEKSEKENKDILLIEAVSGREKESRGNYSKIKIKFLENNIYYFPDGKKKEYADKLNDFFIDDDNIYFFFIKPFLDKYFENHNEDNEKLKDTMQQAYDRENILPSYNIKHENSKNDDKKTRIYTKDHYPLLNEILRLEKEGKNYDEIKSILYGDLKKEEYKKEKYNEKIDDNLEEYMKNIYSKFDDIKLYDESDEDIHPVIYYNQKLYYAPFKIYESFVRKKINIGEYKFFISICKENFDSINEKRKEEIDYIYKSCNYYGFERHDKVLFENIISDEIDFNIKETYKKYITLNDKIILFQLKNNIRIKNYNTDVPEEIFNILYFTDYMEREEYRELKNKISELNKLDKKNKIIECDITSEDEKIIYNTAKAFKFKKMNYISLYKIIKLMYDNSNLENTFKENISLMKNYDKIYNLVKSNQ